MNGAGRHAKRANISAVQAVFGRLSCLLMAVAPWIIIPGLDDFADFPQRAVLQTAAVAFLGCLLAGIALQGKPRCSLGVIHFFLGLFLCWAALSLTWATNRYEAFFTLSHWVACALFFFAYTCGLQRPVDAGRLLLGMMVGVSGLSLLGCWQYLFGVRWVPQLYPPSATLANVNCAMHIVAMGFPVFLAGLFLRTQKRFVVLAAAALFPVLCYLVFSGTRAAWLASVLSLTVVFIGLFIEAKRNDTLFIVSRIRIAVLGLMFITALILNQFGPGDMGKSGMVKPDKPEIEHREKEIWQYGSGRLGIWANSVVMFFDKPLIGYGLSNQRIFYPLYHRAVFPIGVSEGRELIYAHNDFLQIGLELGVTGLLLWLSLLGAAFYHAWRLMLFQVPSQARFWGIGISGTLTAFCVVSFFDFPMQRAIPPFYLATVLAALCVLSAHTGKVAGQIVMRPPRWITLAGGLALLGTLPLVLQFHAANLKSDRMLFLADRARFNEQWPQVLKFAQQAGGYNPYRSDHLYYAGRAHMALGQYETAVRELERLLEFFPHHINIQLSLGLAYCENHDFEKAQKILKQLLAIKPDSMAAYLLLCQSYQATQAYDQAMEWCRKGIANVSEPTRLYYQAGLYELERGGFRQAMRFFEDALQSDPLFVESHRQLAYLYYYRLGRQDKALAHMRAYIAEGRDPEAIRRFRNILFRHQR